MMKSLGGVSLLATSLALCVACGGSQKKAHDAGSEAEAMPELTMTEPETVDAERAEPETESTDGAEKADGPQFEPGMSVEEASSTAPFAVNAVEVPILELEAPLMKSSLYKPCSIPSTQKYKVRAAVYQGKAVGIDVTTEPANEKVEACVREQVEAVEWSVNEKSINIVELSF